MHSSCPALQGDIPRYTDIEPLIEVSEVAISHWYSMTAQRKKLSRLPYLLCKAKGEFLYAES